MSVNRHNRDYDASSPPIPLATGDVYRSQDLMRDMEHIQEKASLALLDLLRTGSNILVSGLRVTQGAGDTISVTTGIGYVQETVTVPDSFATNPPTTRTETVQRRVEVPALTDQAIPSATLDGATTNFVKIAYAEIDVGSRDRLRGAGSYVYEKADSYTLVVNSTAATASELTIATIVGATGGTFTIAQTVEAVSTEGVQLLQEANASQLLPLVPVSSQLVPLAPVSNELAALAPSVSAILASTLWSEQQNLGTSNNVIASTFGNGTFIVGTTDNNVWTSIDGRTWVERQTLDGELRALGFGNNLFLAGTNADSVWTSTDGITWTERQTLDGEVISLAYGNGLYLAGTDGTGDSIWTSTDGITWTERQTLDGGVATIIYDGTAFIAGTFGGTFYRSTDGITWTAGQTLSNAGIRSIAFGNGIYAAAVDDSVGNNNGVYATTFAVAPDGSSGYTQRLTTAGIPRDIVFGGGVFIIGLTPIAGDASIQVSVNGIIWKEVQAMNTTGSTILTLTFGNDIFIAGTAPDSSSVWISGI